jgi:hypothetical protein
MLMRNASAFHDDYILIIKSIYTHDHHQPFNVPTTGIGLPFLSLVFSTFMAKT